jgi:hypothetical protein
LSLLKYKLSFFLLKASIFGFAQNYDYELIYIDANKIYYSIIQDERTLFFGTNLGIYKTDNGIQLIEHNRSVKGPIDKNLKPHIFRVSFITAPKNIPLGEFSNSITAIQSFKNYVYVISRGKLLIYKNKLYSFSPYESVRSITTNYVGSYNGIFQRGELLTFPPYTNGQIKEYDDITFICYDGLFAIQGNQQEILYDAPAGNRKYGAIENIFKLQKNNYVIISDFGLFLYELEENSFEMIYDGIDSNIVPVKKTFRDGFEFMSGFRFGQNYNLYSIDLSSYEVSTIFSFESQIVDMVSAGDIIYVLTNDKKVIFLYSTTQQNFIVNTINLESQPHTIENKRNYLLMSGNKGLSIYDLSENQLHNNVVIDEFNRGAAFKTDNYISLGSIHGVYRFENIDLLVDSISSNFVVNEFDYSRDSILVLIVFLLGFVVLIYMLKNRRRSYNNQEIVIAIKKYIDGNLNTVDVVSISEKFNIDNNLLYHLDSEFKPGDYIKQKRKEKASELIAKGLPIQKIAKLTGYSVSYLKRYF